MDKEPSWRRDGGIATLALAGAVMANLAINGFGPLTRKIIFLFLCTGFVGGLWLVASEHRDFPLWLRTRSWARREYQDMLGDPDHPLYRACHKALGTTEYQQQKAWLRFEQLKNRDRPFRQRYRNWCAEREIRRTGANKGT